VERSVRADARSLRYSFPPHSFTMLRIKMA